MSKRCPNPKCGAITSGDVCHNCGVSLLTVDPITKLRRRCEDVLRKSTPEKIKEVASLLGVR